MIIFSLIAIIFFMLLLLIQVMQAHLHIAGNVVTGEQRIAYDMQS